MALKMAHMELPSVAQRKMERIMLGITLRDHKRNTWIRHETGVNNVMTLSRWKYMDGRDTLHDSKTTDGLKESASDRVDTTRMETRRQGSPKTRWRDNLICHLGPAWPRIATRDRCLWEHFRDGFLLPG